MAGWMDAWIDGRTNGWMDEWMDEWTDRWMDELKNGWMDGQIDDEWLDVSRYGLISENFMSTWKVLQWSMSVHCRNFSG